MRPSTHFLRSVQNWRETIRLRRKPAPRIVAHADRYCVFLGETKLQEVVLSDIKRVTMYKRDLLTTDSVCALVEVFTPGDLAVPVIWEEHAGFYDAISLFATLPGFDVDWQDKVILPPFATNWTVVFDRSADAAELQNSTS